MLSFPEALDKILASAAVLGQERVSLRSAAGRWLAEDLLSTKALPGFDYSAMDGYALNTDSVLGSGPWSLPVEGESRAGKRASTLQPRTACRIFTGAQLPTGADTILLQEEATARGRLVEFSQTLHRGRHIRRRGEDLAVGATALPGGRRLGPHCVALAASLDCTQLLVTRRPRVAILCTGDELRAPGTAGPPESIPESNGLAVAIAAESAGATAELLPLCGDDEQLLSSTLTQAIGTCDLLVTIGGASVGKYDLVRPALKAAGAELNFWKVRIKPGKPVVHGHCGRTLILGLPGNPVSAQVTFSLFGLPLLRSLQGEHNPVPPMQEHRLLEEMRQRPGRMGFYRGTLKPTGVQPLGNQASGNVVSLAHANVLIAMPEQCEVLKVGEMVKTLRISQL